MELNDSWVTGGFLPCIKNKSENKEILGRTNVLAFNLVSVFIKLIERV